MIPIILALSCSLASTNSPDFYTATLRGPNTLNQYDFVLTYHFFNYKGDRKYTLNRDQNNFYGRDDVNGEVKIQDFVKNQNEQFTFVVDSEKDGLRHMVCTEN